MESKGVINYKWVEYRLLWWYYLSQSKTNEWRKEAKMLHRVIWEEKNGEIPKWYVIHHKDHNSLNNSIDNLEIMEKSLHCSYHTKEMFKDDEYRTKQEKHLEEIRPLAAEWHKSNEWKDWHKKHYDESLWKKESKSFICLYCWNQFNSKHYNPKYCSKQCHYEWTKIVKVCQQCWKEFRTRKYYNPKCCSVSCSSKMRKK